SVHIHATTDSQLYNLKPTFYPFPPWRYWYILCRGNSLKKLFCTYFTKTSSSTAATIRHGLRSFWQVEPHFIIVHTLYDSSKLSVYPIVLKVLLLFKFYEFLMAAQNMLTIEYTVKITKFM
ncbi:hypothetical protein L9F63_015175, partial [Diploptera punctata]